MQNLQPFNAATPGRRVLEDFQTGPFFERSHRVLPSNRDGLRVSLSTEAANGREEIQRGLFNA
jgi:hypothetical protein